MNVMIVANSKYMPYAKMMLTTLFQNNEVEINIYLVYKHLSDEEVYAFREYVESWKDKHLHCIYLDDEKTKILKPSNKFPIDIYFKIVGLMVLPNHIDKILYMDVDMIVKKPLGEFYDLNIDNLAAVACKDIYGYVYGAAQDSEVRLNLKSHGRYFNSGLLLFNLDYCRKQNMASRLINYIESVDCNLKWEDQDAFNAVLEGEVGFVSWNLFNCTPVMYVCRQDEIQQGIINPVYQCDIWKVNEAPQDYVDVTQAIYDSAYIIHYIGETKPWREDRQKAYCYDIFDKAYFEYLKRFEIGDI